MGIKLLQRCDIDVAIITGRSSEALERRAGELGITTVIQGREDKGSALEELLTAKGLSAAEVAYMGDDLPGQVVPHIGDLRGAESLCSQQLFER